MSEVVPPELVGQMATVGTTTRSLNMCPSCARALIYGALTYGGAVKGDLEAAEAALLAGQWGRAVDALRTADERQTAMIRLLVQFVHADFDASMADGTALDEADWQVAMDAFLRSRIATYVADDGEILFEPHEVDEAEA